MIERKGENSRVRQMTTAMVRRKLLKEIAANMLTPGNLMVAQRMLHF